MLCKFRGRNQVNPIHLGGGGGRASGRVRQTKQGLEGTTKHGHKGGQVSGDEGVQSRGGGSSSGT
jgi:hypothetical protein